MVVRWLVAVLALCLGVVVFVYIGSGVGPSSAPAPHLHAPSRASVPRPSTKPSTSAEMTPGDAAPVVDDAQEVARRVRVVDENGNGVPNARVFVAPPLRWATEGMGRVVSSAEHLADAHGILELPPSVGRPLLRATSGDGTLASMRLPAWTGNEATLTLGLTGRISGRVTNLGATPAETVQVHANCASWSLQGQLRAVPVDPDGSFHIDAAEWYVTLYAVAAARGPSRKLTVKNLAAGEHRSVELELGPAAISGRVRILEPDGSPWPDCAVRFRVGGLAWLRAETDADGWAGLDHLIPGRLVTVAVRRGTAPSGRSYRPQGTELAVADLVSGATLVVRKPVSPRFVVEDRRGEPIRDLDIVLQRVRGKKVITRDRRARRVAATDENGEFRPFPLGTHDYGPCRLRSQTLGILWEGEIDRETPERIVVRVPELRRIDLDLVSTRSEPIEALGVIAAIVSADTPPATNAFDLTSCGGRTFDGVTRQTWHVPVEHLAYDLVVRVGAPDTPVREYRLPAQGEPLVITPPVQCGRLWVTGDAATIARATSVLLREVGVARPRRRGARFPSSDPLPAGNQHAKGGFVVHGVPAGAWEWSLVPRSGPAVRPMQLPTGLVTVAAGGESVIRVGDVPATTAPTHVDRETTPKPQPR